MPDRQFQIKILTTGDTTGATQIRNELKGITEETGNVGTAGKKLGQELGREVDGLKVKHKEWREMVKGLRGDFPELFHVAHMALHPVTLAVAGIAAAFSLWKSRIQELTAVLGGSGMPEWSSSVVKGVSAATEAFDRLNKATADAVEKYASVGAASERRLKDLHEEVELATKLLAMDKERELAALESQKDALTPTQYASKRAGIEGRYRQAGIGLDDRAEALQYQEQQQRMIELQESSRRKAAEAAALNPLGERGRKNLEISAEHQKQIMEWANKEKTEAMKGLALVNQAAANPYDPISQIPYGLRYAAGGISAMSYDQARALESKRLANANRILITGQQQWAQNDYARKLRLERSADLSKQSEAEAAEAAAIQAGLPDLATTMQFHRQARTLVGDAAAASSQAAVNAAAVGGPYGKELSEAVSGARSLMGGGRASAGEQSAIIAVIQQLNRASNGNGEAMLRSLAMVVDNLDAFNPRFAQIEAKLEALGRGTQIP